MKPRLLCLFVPLFPLAARLRAEPELRSEVLVVCAGQGNAARVVAASRKARLAGIRPGHTLPQARALVPQVQARGRDAVCERSAQEALFEIGESVSPRVEDAGEGVIFVELGTTEELERRRAVRRRKSGATSQAMATPQDTPEVEVAAALERAAAQAGLPAKSGVASSKLAARVAATLPTTPHVILEGEEANFLSPLPLGRLSPAVELSETLNRWGLRSIGELARLPASQIASRLGPEGQKLHTIARGLDAEPLIPRHPPPTFEEGLECEWPLVTLEPLLFLGRAALERLAKRLEARGLGCTRLETHLRLEPDGWASRTIDFPAPTRDVKTLLALLRLELEARPPGAPVVGFRFAATPDRPRDAQLSLLGPSDLSPDRLATTLARLFALLGPGRAGSPSLPDGHRPERSALVPYSLSPMPAQQVSEPPRVGRGLLAIRTFRPPIEIEVITELDRPRSVAPILTTTNDETPARPRVEGSVRVASGPWSVEEGWWLPPNGDASRPAATAASQIGDASRQAPSGAVQIGGQAAAGQGTAAVQREYWDVEFIGGGLYRLFRDLLDQRWYADGLYD